jgi:hypothetical protein
MEHKITELIQEYRAAETVAHNLDYLMSIRKELAIEAFLFSKELAETKSLLEQAKAQRKVDFYTIQAQHLDEGLGKSVVYAEKGIVSVRVAEARYEGEYQGNKAMLNQVNEVLSSLSQDISQLKAEFKAEL